MPDHGFKPDWLSSPGGTISDALSEQGLTVEKFADLLGYSIERTDRLLRSRTPITQEVAIRLEQTIGGSTVFWLSREVSYRDEIGRLQATGNEIAAKAWLDELPFREMVRLGWVSDRATVAEKLNECLSFFDVQDVSSWRREYSGLASAVAFRSSPTFESHPGAVLAWLRHGEIRANSAKCGPWNLKAFHQRLPDIRKLTRMRSPKLFVPRLIKMCAECGVAIVIARPPTGCRASGATRFVSPDKAMILLSFRYLSDDQFWFSFFHEAGHLILHSKRALFLEDDSDATSKEEEEADQFAESILIPAAARTQLAHLPLKKQEIIQFAVRNGISRGIVVGQLQHMGRVARDKLNWMKWHFDRDEIANVSRGTI